MATSHSRVAVECYVRPSLFVEPVDTAVETLQEYNDRKVVDELVIEPWPDTVRLEGAADESVREQYDRLRGWAKRQGASLEPGFLRRERTTLASDRRDTVLTPPAVCLAVRVDGELVNVAPHHTGTAAYTVEDALADIERFAEMPAVQQEHTSRSS